MSFPQLGVMCDNCVRRGCGEEWRIVYGYRINCVRFGAKPQAIESPSSVNVNFETNFTRYFKSLPKKERERILGNLHYADIHSHKSDRS